MDTSPTDQLPVIIIGAGPVGLAAAHVRERGLKPLVLEVGDCPGAAISEWSHTRLFSQWEYNVDDAARRLLEPRGWVAPIRSGAREHTPFLVRVTHADGSTEDLLASKVIDASGTWTKPNPLGQAGLAAPGEAEALANGLIATTLPDVNGLDRQRFANCAVPPKNSPKNTLGTSPQKASNASFSSLTPPCPAPPRYGPTVPTPPKE